MIPLKTLYNQSIDRNYRLNKNNHVSVKILPYHEASEQQSGVQTNKMDSKIRKPITFLPKMMKGLKDIAKFAKFAKLSKVVAAEY